MPVHLLFGDNTLELDEAVKSIRTDFNPADILTFDGKEVSLASLAIATRTAGLFDPNRLVIVRNLHLRVKGGKNDGEWEEVRVLFDAIAPTTTLVLWCAGMTPDHQLVSEVRSLAGDIRSFLLPKRRQDLVDWVGGRAVARRAVISRDAAELLAESSGANPYLIDSEIEKLATYAGEGETITLEMVTLLVGAVSQETIFALVDAIASGQRDKALGLLHEQLDHAPSGPTDLAVYLIRMLARQMRILLEIQYGIEQRTSRDDIISRLRLSRFYAGRYFQQARAIPPATIRGSFEKLAELEHDLKTSRTDGSTGMDLLVVSLCA